MKICPVGAELFPADRRTNGSTNVHEEANSKFSQFCVRLKVYHILSSFRKLKFVRAFRTVR